MVKSPASNSNSIRRSFADQFEQNGTNFVYRKSQKGPAILVSAEERNRFIEQFDRNLVRIYWILGGSCFLVLGALILVSVVSGWGLSQLAIFAGIGLVIIPYVFWWYRAWTAPARELARRTPIAGERSSDEVRRLTLQRITYGQLLTAAATGLLIPFIGSAHQNVFSGWNRIWLVFGGGLIVLAAVQAFRKWRLNREQPGRSPSLKSLDRTFQDPGDDGITNAKSQIWSYVPFVLLVAGVAFIALTSAGKQVAQMPAFWPIVLVALGLWALTTVVRGLARGQVEPFARGFYNTYHRETQPKRFWVSLAWNGLFGCFSIWLAFQMQRDAVARPIRDRCYNESSKYSPQDVVSACNQLIAGKVSPGWLSRADALVNRGIGYAHAGDQRRAIEDYSAAIRVQRKYPEAYYDRGLAYETLGNVARALSDYGSAIQLNPEDPDPYFRRALLYLDMGRFDDAIRDLSRSHDLNPKDLWPLANRGLAFAWKGERTQAERDFAAVRASDPSNYVLLHGEAVLSIKEGDAQGAVDHLTAALKAKPDDRWALQMRAKAFRQLGDNAKADADLERLKAGLRR